MSLTFIRKYPARYALFDGRREVGWLSMQSIGLCGFASAEEARNAGVLAARALTRWLGERRTSDAALLQCSAGSAWSSTAGVNELGVPPPVHVTRRHHARGGHAFEIPLPPDTLFAIAVHAVQVVYNALRSHAASDVDTPVGAAMGSSAS